MEGRRRSQTVKLRGSCQGRGPGVHLTPAEAGSSRDAGAPAVGGSGQGAGLAEDSPLQREREPGVGPPRLQQRQQQIALPPLPSAHPLFLAGRAGGGRWSTSPSFRAARGSPCSEAQVLGREEMRRDGATCPLLPESNSPGLLPPRPRSASSFPSRIPTLGWQNPRSTPLPDWTHRG